MSTIIYGRHRQYRTDTNIGGFPILVGSSAWGTMPAATADKVHLTRILIAATPIGPQPETLAIPPANYVTGVVVAKEEELPFLMRQKRSYELATGP